MSTMIMISIIIISMLLRTLYVVLLVALVTIRFRWHIRARVLEPGVANVPEGWPIRAVRLIMVPLWLAAMLWWPISPESFAWQALGLPVAAQALGAAIVAGGLVLLHAVHEHLRENFSPFLRIRADHHLVATGPYRRVRHPMYTAFILILGGFSVLTDSALLLVATVLMAAAIAHRTRAEETMLLARFGSEYAAYRDRTGVLWPRLMGRSTSG